LLRNLVSRGLNDGKEFIGCSLMKRSRRETIPLIHLIHRREWFAAFVMTWLTGFSGCTIAVPPGFCQTSAGPPQKARRSVREKEIQEARKLLGELGYWVIEEVKGLDASLRHALIAFQKMEGRERTGVLTSDELLALREARRPKAVEIGYPHIEVDLKHQVLLVVDCCGAILRLLPISSGSGKWFTEGGRTRRAVTPLGRFTVAYQIRGWRRSPLGRLYYPNYISDGIAIHGNPSVPVTPASHGCIRIPMFAAREFSDMALPGVRVLIHEGYPLPPLDEVTDLTGATL
jgi:hypothetical protein